MSEPLRIDGQIGISRPWRTPRMRSTGADIMVVQWLRFGSGGFLQMIGISRADVWTGELSRLRTCATASSSK